LKIEALRKTWRQLKLEAQRCWHLISEEELETMQGTRDELIAVVQQRYGRSREEAEQEVDNFIRSHLGY
jgi:uncharacterized protein YjbJ (UPF0337 family)